MNPHTFHIPVLGTAFTIDTPIKVARFGISSVISLADDFLIEDMRKVYATKYSQEYTRIENNAEDARARRITSYLNLVNYIVNQQIENLKQEEFKADTEITKYFELLPDGVLKTKYQAMLNASASDRHKLEEELRGAIRPGRIDVNIMTKLDRDNYKNRQKLPSEFSDALAGLRGFAQSDLSNACVVFSAGMNPRLYGYATEFKDFYPNEEGVIKKGIILKVSDYRSTATQGKFLAKRGLWVQEYRIESGLNCGGHAFATAGLLMGPILQEFKDNRDDLQAKLVKIWLKGIDKQKHQAHGLEPKFGITYQGGLGSAQENKFLCTYYNLEGTGWGTPFMLVPEAITIDDDHLLKLAKAKTGDVCLSKASPLGVPFWLLKASSSEDERKQRISANKSGSPCPQGILKFDTEFTEVPICTASRGYQNLKLKQLQDANLSDEQRAELIDDVLCKSCICKDLGGSAQLIYNVVKQVAITVCSGPNIVNFSQTATLQEMVDFIYGRVSGLADSDRPHVFLNELNIYIEYFRTEWHRFSIGLLDKKDTYFKEFQQNLLNGVEYYKNITENFMEDTRSTFLTRLDALRREVEHLIPV